MGKSKVLPARSKSAVSHVKWKEVQLARGKKIQLVEVTPESKRMRMNSPDKSPMKHSLDAASALHATPAYGNQCHDAEADHLSYLEPLRLPKQKVIGANCGLRASCPFPTPDISVQSQNDYLREWLPHQQQYLDVLLAQEAPPEPRSCNVCGGDGVYKCSDCFAQPLFCTSCCRQQHLLNPLHRIQQWSGKCFEDSALSLVGAP
jgi:hypothetical protein